MIDDASRLQRKTWNRGADIPLLKRRSVDPRDTILEWSMGYQERNQRIIGSLRIYNIE